MRYLTQEHWKSFELSDGRFDGVKFEQLVATILPKLYPGRWQPTGYSWDGKKDFYQQSGDERRWAECKAYKEPISINIISPTLIMALLKDARVILLFSYSKLNRNARLYLGQFATLTERTIRVYDDETLEDLILTHSDVRTFFPTISVPDLPPVRNVTAHARLSQDPDVEYHAGNVAEQDDGDVYLSLLSTFSVDVLVNNEGVNSPAVSGRVRLEPSDLIDRFWLYNQDPPATDPSVPFMLEPGESFFHRFYLRARRSGRLAAPRITVEVDGERPKRLRLQPIEVSSILAVPLIGKRPHDALALFRQSVSARDKPIYFHLHGQSGTGKSRLLREFRDELLGRGFLVFTFNGEDERNSSFDNFVRKLASTICKLPMLDQVVRPAAADTGFDAVGGDQSLLDLLYCDASRPSQNRDSAIRTVLGLLATRKAAVVIDNMQFLDADTIALINTAITETRGTAARNAWVIGLNTDVLTAEMPAAGLSGRLKALAADEPDSVLTFHVEGFTQEDARHYLDEALAGDISETRDTLFTATHPDTSALIINRVGTRPLFLEQALQYAADRGGLGLRAGRLYVADIERFHSAIEGLPGRIRELIAKRWSFIGGRLPAGAVSLVKALAELISMPMPIAHHLGVTRDEIHTLVGLGIVDITESNEVRFHHRQHYLYFTDLYRDVPTAFARQLLGAVDTAGYSGAYPFQDAMLRDALGEFRDEDLRKIATVIIDKSVVGPARQRVTPSLLGIFNRPGLAVDPGTELRVINTLCQELKRHVAFETAAAAFQNAYALRVPRCARYLSYGEDYFGFIHDYVNSFFAVHRDGEALPLLESALSDLPRFQFNAEAGRLLARGLLLNRLCVALKTIHDLDAAERSARDSLRIAQQLNDARLIYKNYIDWGYIYHGFRRFNDELSQKWSAALEVFEREAATEPSVGKERASALLHSGELLVLARRWEDAIQIIEEGIRYSRRTLTPFHEVKLLLLRVVAELAWGNAADPKDLMRWVDMAEDRAVTTRALRSYWVVFYTRAKLYLISNDRQRAAGCFIAALEQLAKVLTDTRMEERYEPFFEDLAIQLRLSGRVMEKGEALLIRNARIRRVVESILTMAAHDFDDWISRYEPTATFDDGRYNLPVP
jgi:tetratricopeptide (TPR) repeat protein